MSEVLYGSSFLLCSVSYLSAFVCDQGSQGFGIEATVGEPQAAVHAVSRELQGLLSDVILREKEGKGTTVIITLCLSCASPTLGSNIHGVMYILFNITLLLFIVKAQFFQNHLICIKVILIWESVISD